MAPLAWTTFAPTPRVTSTSRQGIIPLLLAEQKLISDRSALHSK
jgi:hypothetical protein